MGAVFSAISGKFSQSLILGTVAPVAAFLILCILFVAPVLPLDAQWLAPLAGFDLVSNLIVFTLVTIVLSLLLYNLNSPIIRFYEGYPWKDSWFGVKRTNRHKKELGVLQARYAALRILEAQTPAGTLKKQLRSKHRALMQVLRTEYPIRVGSVLPTRLGNIMRSYENYPEREYNMAGISLWARLIAVIDKDYAAALDDAKTSFDFMLNSSVLSAALVLLLLVSALLNPGIFITPRTGLVWLVQVLVMAAWAWLFYLFSIPRATARGNLVKGAFDLYRDKLLSELGYTRKIKDRAAERKVWSQISEHLIYGDDTTEPEPAYGDPDPPASPRARSDEPRVTLQLTRAVELSANDDTVTIVLGCKNPGGMALDGKTFDPHLSAPNVIVTDTLAAGWLYVWDTAEVAGRSIKVTGTNPYEFPVGAIAGSTEIKLTYRAARETPCCPADEQAAN